MSTLILFKCDDGIKSKDLKKSSKVFILIIVYLFIFKVKDNKNNFTTSTKPKILSKSHFLRVYEIL